MANSILGVSLVQQSKRGREMRCGDIRNIREHHKKKEKFRIRILTNEWLKAWKFLDTYYVYLDDNNRPIARPSLTKHYQDDWFMPLVRWKKNWKKKFNH